MGNYLASLLNIDSYGFWQSLISTTVGAILVITIYRAVTGSRPGY